MSKKLTLFVFMLFGAFLLSTTMSCDKALEKLTPNFSCTIDGVNWTTHSVVGSATDSTILYMAMEDSIMVSVALRNLTEGTFVIDNINNFATCTQGQSENIYLGKSGSINVSEITDLKVNFTFNFKGYNFLGDSVHITNGVGENLIYIK